MTFLLGPAIAHQHAEQALADQAQFLNSTIDSLDSVFLQIDPDGSIVRTNDACREASGFTFEELRYRSFSGAFLLPEETVVVHDALGRVRDGETGVRCETFLLTKQGDRRRIAWSLSRSPGNRNQGSAIITGIDITDQCNVLARLDELGASIREYDEKQETQGPTDPIQVPEHYGAAADSPPKAEHRSHRRRAYPYIQAIGLCRDGELPELLQFHEVRCRDISRSLRPRHQTFWNWL
ncbi:MAG: hypothetical protein CMJ64_06030 [Planctomycetaceae bacterium]|nr:hypothetical protein [Planctomycetaceae bacterium]